MRLRKMKCLKVITCKQFVLSIGLTFMVNSCFLTNSALPDWSAAWTGKDPTYWKKKKKRRKGLNNKFYSAAS